MVFIARQAFEPALDAAVAGAAAQSRQSAGPPVQFPAIGLHWLHGLLLLRSGQTGAALSAFAREIDGAQDSQIYGSEFRVNAQVAAGFAHLEVGDVAGAIDAFRFALEILPRNGRALVGLHRCFERQRLTVAADRLDASIDQAIAELSTSGRSAEAALVTAASLGARGDLDRGCTVLQRLVDAAPPGQAGWQIPVDPALSPLRSSSQFAQIQAHVATRAS
jgi:tetratricopeptide (TPR) repeat protein